MDNSPFKCVQTQGGWSNPYHWYSQGGCSPQETCVEAEESAFCAESTEKDPRCTSDGATCDGDHWIFCEKGYLTNEIPCLKCSSDEGVVACSGTASSPCTRDADCLPELFCDTGMPEPRCKEVTLCKEDFQCNKDEVCANYRGQEQCLHRQ